MMTAGGDNFIMTSADDGQIWTLGGNTLPGVSGTDLGTPRVVGHDPNNPNIVHAGLVNEKYGGIWETTDALMGANAVWSCLGDGVSRT